jgi:hypothetical protein
MFQERRCSSLIISVAVGLPYMPVSAFSGLWNVLGTCGLIFIPHAALCGLPPRAVACPTPVVADRGRPRGIRILFSRYSIQPSYHALWTTQRSFLFKLPGLQRLCAYPWPGWDLNPHLPFIRSLIGFVTQFLFCGSLFYGWPTTIHQHSIFKCGMSNCTERFFLYLLHADRFCVLCVGTGTV